MKGYVAMFSLIGMWGISSAARGASNEGAIPEAGATEQGGALTGEDAAAGTSGNETTFTMENGAVFFTTGETRSALPLPAPAVAIFQHRTTLYVALGRHGAVIFDISTPGDPRQVKTLDAGAEAIAGFAVVDGEVWARRVSTKIVPFGVGEGTSGGEQETDVPHTAMEQGKPEVDEREGAKADKSVAFERPIKIIKVEDGKATLDVGATDGVQVGDRFSIFKAVTMRGAAGESFVGSELAAVVEVVAVNTDRCLVSLWRGDRVTTADTVRPRTREHRRSMVFPRHLTDLGELSVTLRPILNVDGPIGFGALNSLEASYWGRNYFVSLVLDPVGFAFTDDGNMGLMNAAVEAGFNSRAFAIGVGAGFQVIRFDKPAFAITQTVRLGAKDGLNFEARNAFHLRKRTEYNYDYYGSSGPSEEEYLGFEWGGLTSQLNIPVGSRLTLFFGGGGGDDFFYGEGGVHAWLRGNGDKGSIGLSAAAGAAGLFASNYDYDDYSDSGDNEINITAIGPMVSLGLDWRFGFN